MLFEKQIEMIYWFRNIALLFILDSGENLHVNNDWTIQKQNNKPTLHENKWKSFAVLLFSTSLNLKSTFTEKILRGMLQF